MFAPVPRSQEGRFAIVTNVGAGCDGRFGRADERGPGADAEVVWSWSPDAGIEPCEMSMSAFGPTRRAGPRRLSSPALRREHEVGRNTIAQGMPDRFGVPVVTCLRAFFTCTQGCGCDKHPAFPAPSCFRGWCYSSKLGHILPRDREPLGRRHHRCERSLRSSQ
jgi:hypothetical protein